MRRLWLLIPVCLAVDPSPPPHPVEPSLSSWTDGGTSLPSPEEFEQLARTDPVAMLDACLRRALREVKGYRAVTTKQETIDGTTYPQEEILVSFQADPYSVSMQWLKGARNALRAVYVEGENGGLVLIRPNPDSPLGLLARAVPGDPVFARGLDHPRVREASRYPLNQTSLPQATERTWRAWRRAQAAGRLHVEYLGRRPLPEAGGRVCHVLRRHCDPPEEEGLVTLEIAIDAETWLQVYSRLTDGRGGLIGSYAFRDVEINPTFPPDQFTRAALLR
jgi:hypothetical protein